MNYLTKTQLVKINKLTTSEAGLIFLRLNGYQLSPSITDPMLTDFILSVASGAKKLEEVQEWIRNYAIAI